MATKEQKNYYQYEFETDDPEFFEDKTICFFFEKIGDNRFRLILKRESEVFEIVKFINDNFTTKDKKSYNNAVKAIGNILKVIITTDQCKKQVEEATKMLTKELESLRKEMDSMRQESESMREKLEKISK